MAMMTPEQEVELQQVLDTPSLYPEAPRKERAIRESELRDWFEKYDEVNKCYNLYGMDRADAQPCDDWLDIKTFGKQRYAVNSTYVPAGTRFSYNHTLLTRNKLMFEMFLSYWYGAESRLYMPSRAIFQNGSFFILKPGAPRRMEPAEFKDFLACYDTGEKLVFKEAFGARGKEVYIVELDAGDILLDGERLDAEEFAAKLSAPGFTWLAQDYIEQHETMASFNPTSVNTLRIVTYHTGERCFVEDAAVRMGYPGALVDNAFSDGYYTNVDEDGKLDESLFNFSLKTRTLHDFGDVRIPAMREALDLCVELHSRMPELYTAGWDIAITHEGKPLVIECNDSWAVFVTQTAIGHAARPSWNKYLAERRAYEANVRRTVS